MERGALVVDEEEVAVDEERLARRVSWIPGAEGAPFGREGGLLLLLLAERLVVRVGWGAWGIMRRDWGGFVS